MVVAKDKSAIPRYYDPDFVMVSNGITQEYEGFRAGHETVYDTPISYAVEYDDESWVESDDRVAVRLWITTSRPGEDRDPPRAGPHRHLPRGTHPSAVGAHVAELGRPARVRAVRDLGLARCRTR